MIGWTETRSYDDDDHVEEVEGHMVEGRGRWTRK